MTEEYETIPATLLPPSRTPWEEALSETNAARRPLPWEILARLWNPWTCPESVLPYLANSLSVDLWFDDWPVERKRLITARAFELTRLKGRVEAVRRIVPFVDSRLVKAITPPAKTFLMPKYSDEEKQAFLDLFAQIRIRPFVRYGTYPYASFTTAAYHRSKAYLGAMCVKETLSGLRYRSEAYLWDHGPETALTTRQIAPEKASSGKVQTYVEVAIPKHLADCIFLNQPPKARIYLGAFPGSPARLFTAPSSADTSLYLARETYTTFMPTGDLIYIRPEKVREVHQAQGHDLFLGRPLAGCFMPPSIAWRHIYDRYYLFDPDRVPRVRKESVHLGYTRLGMPAYHAEYRIAIKGKLKPREAQRFVGGFLRVNAQEPLRRTVLATKVSKAARDKAMIYTRTMREVAVSDRVRLSAGLSLGQMLGI